MNISSMRQEHNLPIPKVSLRRNSSYDSYQAKKNSTTQGKNRLGPYTTTPPSAQIKALKMLNLKPSDVFFDLGCSDGRLIVMALEEAIDQEIEERRKEHLTKLPAKFVKWNHSRCNEKNDDCLMGECCHVVRMRRTQNSRENKTDTQDQLPLKYCLSEPSFHNSINRVDDFDDGHRRNHSFDSFTVPHLMRNSSNDSMFDDVLDDLSDDALDAHSHHSSWQTAPTRPISDLEDEKSPITPLISNRKVLQGGEGPLKINEPPLETKCHEDELKKQKPQQFLNNSDESAVESDISEKLRCVGIEIDESLAERANCMVNKSLSKYRNKSFCSNPDSLSQRIHIRCGDILDEWIEDSNIDGVKSIDHYTLLDDATAVFVYLSPEGLKKVKPILFEAALRRRRSQRDLNSRKRSDSVQQWKDLLRQTHQQQPKVVDELELLEFERMPLDSVSKGHQTRISDITNYDSDWDGQCRVNSSIYDNGKDNDSQKFIIGSPLTTFMQSTISSLRTNMSLYTSPFRVVTYMYPIPGWRCTGIDKTSSGNYPLYLYEDIDMETELNDAAKERDPFIARTILGNVG